MEICASHSQNAERRTHSNVIQLDNWQQILNVNLIPRHTASSVRLTRWLSQDCYRDAFYHQIYDFLFSVHYTVGSAVTALTTLNLQPNLLVAQEDTVQSTIHD